MKSSPPGRPGLLLLTGEPSPRDAVARLLRAFGPLETRALRLIAGRGPDLAAAGLVVTSGLSLQDDDTFRRLDAVLRVHRAPTVPLLCLLDRPTRRDAVRARMLGTAALLPAGAGAGAVFRALRRLAASAGAASTPDPVEQVGVVLAEVLFRAAAGTAIDRDTCAAATSTVMAVLDEDGIAGWMRLVEQVHDATYRHCLLVSGLVSAFAAHLGHDPADVAVMTEAAMLHDVGKALVPLPVIDKPGPLSEAEAVLMRRHPADGHALLDAAGGHDPLVLSVVRSHHEYLDGSGYPDRLFRHQISDAVRIVTICDVFAALVEERAYKPAMSAAAACDALEDMGGRLDRRFVMAFRRFLGPVLLPGAGSASRTPRSRTPVPAPPP